MYLNSNFILGVFYLLLNLEEATFYVRSQPLGVILIKGGGLY